MLNLALARERLRSQMIDLPAAITPEAVVAAMGGMQAQDYAQAVWAIGLRCGAMLQQVEDAIRERKIVRLWLMRQTIHFAPRHAVRAVLSVTGSRMLLGMAARLRELELDAATLDKSSAFLVETLHTRGELDRATLLRLLDEAGIATSGQRGYYMLGVAGMRGLIAMGVEAKKNPIYFELEPATQADVADEEGLSWLVTRFFAAHGPATQEDFVRWAGVTIGQAREGIAKCQAFLTPDADGMIRQPHPPSPSPVWRGGEEVRSSGVHLLPGFDEYYIGYKDRDAMLDPAHADKICPGGNGVFKPMIVSDSEICGVWSREFKRDRVVITPAPFRPLRDDERDGLEGAAAGFGAFWGTAAEVRWG
jgi:hypothetical protein